MNWNSCSLSGFGDDREREREKKTESRQNERNKIAAKPTIDGKWQCYYQLDLFSW